MEKRKFSREGHPILSQDDIKNLILSRLDKKGAKGLIILGKAGCGKTYVVEEIFRKVSQEPKKSYYTSLELVKAFRNGVNLNNLLSYQLGKEGHRILPLMIDDIGMEYNSHNYQNQSDVVGDIIYEMYASSETIKKYGHPTGGQIKLFLTSNLNREDLYSRYGTRFAERIDELCDFVIMEGESRRTPKNKENRESIFDELDNIEDKS